MEDFNALAAALWAGIRDARGCLILSRDGLVLGSHPDGAETTAKPAWLKLAGLGDPERGFLQFGTEVWCFVRRGPYAALAVTGPAVRPGPVIDQMEQVLLAAEEARSRREGLKFPPLIVPQAPTARPRTSLHPEPNPEDEPLVIHTDPSPTRSTPIPAIQDSPSRAASPPVSAPAERPLPAPDRAPMPSPQPRSSPPPEEPKDPADEGSPESPAGTPGEAEEAGEVDRFSLAREFSRLLQDGRDPADG